jgi:hypothetical protein
LSGIKLLLEEIKRYLGAGLQLKNWASLVFFFCLEKLKLMLDWLDCNCGSLLDNSGRVPFAKFLMHKQFSLLKVDMKVVVLAMVGWHVELLSCDAGLALGQVPLESLGWHFVQLVKGTADYVVGVFLHNFII